MKSNANIVLPHRSSFSVYGVNEDYLIIYPSVSFWFKLSKEQLLAFRLLDGKSNLQELLRNVSEQVPQQFQETCSVFLRSLAKHFPRAQVQRSKPKRLSLLYFALTNRCNSSCVYCFRNANKVENAMIDKSLIKRAIMSFREISSPDATIVYTGGEPTCYPDLIEIADYARDYKFKNTLQTNGLLISRNVGLYARVFDTIQISLDSIDETINDWLRGKQGHLNLVKEAIRFLKQYPVRVRLATTITRRNLEDITRIRDVFPDIEFQYTPMLKIGRGESMSHLSLSPTEFLEHLGSIPNGLEECVIDIPKFGEKNMSCGAGSSILSVSPEGDVFPCQMLHHETLKCGNLREQTLEEIFHSSTVLKRFRQYSVDTIENCKKCPIRYICGGGCLANGFWIRNRIFDRDCFCEYNKNIIFCNLNNQFKEATL